MIAPAPLAGLIRWPPRELTVFDETFYRDPRCTEPVIDAFLAPKGEEDGLQGRD